MSLDTTRRNLLQLRSDLAGLSMLVRAVPHFIKDRVTLERAEEEIKNGLEIREERFLQLVRTRVFRNPDSPYLRLFRFAGCDFADLRNSVRSCGLEQTLEKLAREGVYLLISS